MTSNAQKKVRKYKMEIKREGKKKLKRNKILTESFFGVVLHYL